MPTLTKTPAGRWKAVIRRSGWPTVAKTWRTKRDAEDWTRRTEDEMARGVFQSRAPAERLTLSAAIDRYLRDVTPTKKQNSQTKNTNMAITLAEVLKDTAYHLDQFAESMLCIPTRA